jgi:AraC-like DNA-binding protein
LILRDSIPAPKIAATAGPAPELAMLVSTMMGSPSAATVDRVLHDTVELCRTAIRLERTAIFLVDETNHTMVGTWGTDHRGRTVDEHNIVYSYGTGDRTVFDRAERGMPWTLFENCPLVSQLKDETRVFGTGWVACTPIRGPGGALGVMFNDAAITAAAFDEEKQGRAAILCALLGQALDRCRRHLMPVNGQREKRPHPLVQKVTRLLADDPSLTCSQLAEHIHLSAGRLARTFKREAQISVVDHRNDLRLARFLDRVDGDGGNFLEAALDAGFGSYAQFHRVFRARFGRAPRAYLAERNAKGEPAPSVPRGA